MGLGLILPVDLMHPSSKMNFAFQLYETNRSSHCTKPIVYRLLDLTSHVHFI